MDVSNASLLDEATSCAEAVALSHSYHKEKRPKYFVSESVFPQNLDVMKTRSELLGVELVVGNIADFPWLEAEQFSGILV
jgi:glycine dehydrogenase